MEYSKQVPAVARTLRLLEVLAGAPDGLSAGELIERLQLSRSTLFALLNTLKERCYIEQRDSRGRYRVGSALWVLLPGRQHGLGPVIEAFQTDIETGIMAETVALVWLDRAETVVVAQIESQRPVRAVFRPGERQPAHLTAAGLVLLAGLCPGTWEHYLTDYAPGLTSTLPQVRREGLAHNSRNETVEIACPICPDGTQPVAALLMRIPAFRFCAEGVEAYASSLRQAAARLSYRLGAPVYQPYGWALREPIGPTEPLKGVELDTFLRGAWGARLACVRQDGTPHVVPLWYEWDGQFAWVTASPGAYWREYVKQSNSVSLTVDEPWPPLRRALIVGRAESVPDLDIRDGLTGLRGRLTARYLGQGSEARAESRKMEGWRAFRILPHKITGHQGLGN